jgi:hypothetical protein
VEPQPAWRNSLRRRGRSQVVRRVGLLLTLVVCLLKRNHMGVWGTAIFSDDLAADLRDDYRAMIGDVLSGPEASDLLLREWMPS